jgi:hypothetical protein
MNQLKSAVSHGGDRSLYCNFYHSSGSLKIGNTTEGKSHGSLSCKQPIPRQQVRLLV